MISGITKPNKNDLIKSLSKMRNPTINIVEVFDRTDKIKVMKMFDRLVSKGHFSVILIKE
jgi:hypothetical protein